MIHDYAALAMIAIAFLLGAWVNERAATGKSVIPFIPFKPEPKDDAEPKPTRFTSKL